MKTMPVFALAAALSFSLFAVSTTPTEAKRGFKTGAVVGFVAGKTIGKAAARGRSKSDEQSEHDEENEEVSAERTRLRAERVRQYNIDHAQKQPATEKTEQATAPIGNVLNVSQTTTKTAASNTANKAVCIAGCD
jgi:hypothetical protein